MKKDRPLQDVVGAILVVLGVLFFLVYNMHQFIQGGEEMRTILAACLLLALAAPAHAAYNGQFHSNPGLKFGSYNPSFNYGRSVPSPRYQLQMPDPLPGYHYRMKPRRKPWSAP